jgi:hypothetical protein
MKIGLGKPLANVFSKPARFSRAVLRSIAGYLPMDRRMTFPSIIFLTLHIFSRKARPQCIIRRRRKFDKAFLWALSYATSRR